VVGHDEEFEPLEMEEAEGMDLPDGEGLSVHVEEYEDDDSEELELDTSDEEADVPPARPGPPTFDSNLMQTLLNRAKEAAQAGEHEVGIQLFSDVLDAEPNNVTARVGRGHIYLDLGDFSRAMSDFTVAEELAGNDPEPQVAMGDLYFARKDYRKAIDSFNAALSVAPNHAKAYCRRGISHYYRKNYAEAVDDLNRALRLDPEIPNIQTYVTMARKKVPARR
jgi:tetratricopeptide (TPR) repeat protein